MGGQVMVFAPAPQLTITVERVNDQGEDHDDLHLHPGGQGIWQARMVAALGVPVTLCAVLGGETGRVLESLIGTEDVRLRAVGRDSSNGWYVHDRRDGKRRVIADQPGEPLGRHELDELYDLALAEGLRAEVSVLSGPGDPNVVTPDAYRRLASDLTGNGQRVAADLSGEHLAAVVGGEPVFVKVSHEDLGHAPDDMKALTGELRHLHSQGAGTVVVSRAELPALALLDDQVYEVSMPPMQVTDARGAGDSMTAGVVSVLARGGDMHSAVRAGAAAGALNVTRHGLGTGRADAIAELAERVRVKPVETT